MHHMMPLMVCVLVFCMKGHLFSTDLNHDTYECTGNCEQNNVLCEPGRPKGTILNANSTQHFLEPEFLFQHQAFDGHTHSVHEGQHQKHGEDSSNTLDETGHKEKQSNKLYINHSKKCYTNKLIITDCIT